MSRTYILLIIAAVLLLALLILYIIDRRLKINKQKAVRKKLATIGEVEKEGKSYYLIIDNKQIQLIFFSLKNNEFLTINSHKMMQIDRGIDNKPTLIKYNYKHPPYKWLIIAPGLNRVKKAINENEVIFVDYLHEFDNFRVIREEEIDNLVEEYKNR